MFKALKKYAVFSGRASRKEYWLFFLLYFSLIVITISIENILEIYDAQSGFGPISSITTVGLAVPCISVLVRRLHDINKSGLWALLTLVPIANLVLLFFSCLEGTKGENRFGSKPKS